MIRLFSIGQGLTTHGISSQLQRIAPSKNFYRTKYRDYNNVTRLSNLAVYRRIQLCTESDIAPQRCAYVAYYRAMPTKCINANLFESE
jgi:hypothetical protein